MWISSKKILKCKFVRQLQKNWNLEGKKKKKSLAKECIKTVLSKYIKTQFYPKNTDSLKRTCKMHD